VLIVDDDDRARVALATAVRSHGDAVETAGDPAAALGALADRHFDVVFADMHVAATDDLAMLRAMRRCRPAPRVILLSAHGTVGEAVHVMQAGAYDYLAKPLGAEQVSRVLDRVIGETRAGRREGGFVADGVEQPQLLESSSPAMQRAIDTARQVAWSDATVLLTGEIGSGKSMLARAIHAWSPRHAASFITVPCAALTDRPATGGPFGSVGWAVPFAGMEREDGGPLAAARGGTLFLDEVGDLPHDLQRALLGILPAQSFDALPSEATGTDPRIIAASHRDLDAEVSTGRFRDDLFFRLNVVTIALPPLRERGDDLFHLAEHLLTRLASRYGRGALRIAPDVRRILAGYHWPANVLELVNVLEGAVILSRGDTITPDHLPDRLLDHTGGGGVATPTNAVSLEELERQHIERVLASSGTLEEAATRLGINPTTLWRKRKRYSLPPVATAGHPTSRRTRRRMQVLPDKRGTGPDGGTVV
jgi:two-component system, NtrC family, response regulator AlgB